jgi:hypothetical protein
MELEKERHVSISYPSGTKTHSPDDLSKKDRESLIYKGSPGPSKATPTGSKRQPREDELASKEPAL